MTAPHFCQSLCQWIFNMSHLFLHKNKKVTKAVTFIKLFFYLSLNYQYDMKGF